ncbi:MULTISPECIES: hypothetical protein [Actinoplanes]|uniref:hypothetical protein n=1 Tax=Actinoplanes TaxID=1865 RepID=UPI0005F29DB7|nr:MULTISPECIES: hypothetical protein [Actinoplanes]GLY02012.1 hypothetical protein Acsp01_23910 [Actinoplanes sp. NBRC 101535]
MTGNGLEERLRDALTARAEQITQERLRFGEPPTVAALTSPSRWRRWWWVPLPAGLAVAGAVLGALTLTGQPPSPDPKPLPPASSAEPSTVISPSVPLFPPSTPAPSASTNPSATTSKPGRPELSPDDTPPTVTAGEHDPGAATPTTKPPATTIPATPPS